MKIRRRWATGGRQRSRKKIYREIPKDLNRKTRKESYIFEMTLACVVQERVLDDEELPYQAL